MKVLNNKTKVVMAMSGGVDSSVAVALLKKEGYQVSGVTMQIWGGDATLEEGSHHACYGPGEAEDIEDARKVARILGIPFYVFDLRQEYKTEVLDFYCQEYLSGRTPNPCWKCNRTVKFGALMDKTRQSGIEFDYFATGHYARVKYSRDTGRYLLKKAKDLSKDQSYFLSSLSQEQLRQALFPLGDYTKSEIRKMASDFGLPVSDKPESQDFIAGGYQSLIAAAPAGPIVDKQGNTLGEHRGIPFYTIGQRKGLSISAEKPQYVTDIDAENNTIVVGSKEELYHNGLIASGLNWIAIEKPEQPIEVEARIRYRHQEAEATVTPIDEDKVYVNFKTPQLSITPGQTVVFYRGDVVLGGGIIDRTKE
ncbi:MAG: tRNA 2-thiouridine(34) synthase MnmA [Chloroflexi bacterium]|nr:tRNA 2-thiouridine(34) synthase MnmA [Chloroflexota bacterium]